MSSQTLLLAMALSVALAMPRLVEAQEIGLSGTVTDDTQAVLPGATVTALHVETGNVFVGVAEASGAYRIGAIRPGVYRVTAELEGFATVTQERIELLVGQRAVLNFTLTLSAVREAITVTGQSPLVDVTQSSLGGNVDTRQVQELPVNGRNWMALTMLAPGSRANSVAESPLGHSAGFFQLNLDGHQVTNTLTGASLGQPKFSRDAIAEFELVSSRFDATQGRSRGIQVNAVSKAGTNTYAGTVSGYFRDDSLNAKDYILNRVLAYSNEQVSATFGGPIKKDKVHIFGYYEYEREPNAVTFNSVYSRLNIADIVTTRTQHLSGGRLDAQLSANTRLMIRGNGWTQHTPAAGGGATVHPSTASFAERRTAQVFGSLIQTFGQKVNELKAGFARFRFDADSLVPDSPLIYLRGYTIGKTFVYPLSEYQDMYSVRDDFTAFKGRHEVKLGGEVLVPNNFLFWANFRDSLIDARNGPIPGNLEDLFPVWNDVSTWNLAALSPITRQVRRGFGDFEYRRTKPEYAGWFQDNWQVNRQLTLNLGLRWDFITDAYAKEVDLPPLRKVTPQEWWNFGPRLGVAYSLPDAKTVLRGGWGLYFTGVTDHVSHVTYVSGVQTVAPEIFNDGRPDFASNPFNGPAPTFEEAKRMRRDYATSWISSDTMRTPYSHQTSMGLQRQIGQTMAVQADYIWMADRRVENFRNVNLSFNPATGANFPFTDISKRPYPEWGLAVLRFTDSHTNYHALETAFTKRFSSHWQATATYTLAGTWNLLPLPLNPGCQYPLNGLTMTCNTPFPVPIAKDLGGEYTLSAVGGEQANVSDQRHRAVFNGIWELPYGFQLSGLYFFGSGERYITTYGGNLRDSGLVPEIPSRLRPDGTVVPRNNFVGKPLHRVDMRVQRRFPLPGGARVDGIVEVFNLFNHANYGSYVTDEVSPAYGRPVPNPSVAYQPRMLQLGFRVAF